MSKPLKIAMMIALTVLSLLTLILSLAGGGLFPIILACVLSAAVLVGQVLVVIRSIRKKEFLRIAVAGLRIAAAVLLCLAVIGLSANAAINARFREYGSDETIDSFDSMVRSWHEYVKEAKEKYNYTDEEIERNGYSVSARVKSVGENMMMIFPASGAAIVRLAMNRVWLLIVGLVLCLAAAGLAVFLNLRETGSLLYAFLPSFVKKPENAAPRARKAPKSGGVPIRPDLCCICGRPLTSGYAPLFKLPNGGEARIDETCSNRINTLYSSDDKQQIYEAANYLYDLLPRVNPAVVPYMENYIRVGNEKLNAPQ